MARILIVEDEAKIARFVELELTHEGYEVEKAADGQATKIIVPSEIQSLAGLAASFKGLLEDEKK